MSSMAHRQYHHRPDGTTKLASLALFLLTVLPRPGHHLGSVTAQATSSSSSQYHQSLSAAYDSCHGANEEIAQLQLFVGRGTASNSSAGRAGGAARWTLRCNDDIDPVWDGSTGAGGDVAAKETSTSSTSTATTPPRGSWIFEYLCVQDADTCQFTLAAPGGTFYALVVGATTIAVSNKEQVESIDETVCFGYDCDRPPLELDDDDHVDDDGTTTVGGAGSNNGSVVGGADPATTSTTRGGGAGPNAIENKQQGVKLTQQKGFIIWIVSLSFTLVVVLFVWYWTAKIRHLRAISLSAYGEAQHGRRRSKDDETTRDDSACERDDEEASRQDDDDDIRQDSSSVAGASRDRAPPSSYQR